MLTPIEKDSRRLVTKARLTQTNLINGQSHFIMCRWQNIVLYQQETALPNEKKEISKKLKKKGGLKKNPQFSYWTRKSSFNFQ